MKAVRIHSYGGLEVLVYEDAPQPTIADEAILVRVHAAGVNPVDWKIREGYFQSSGRHNMPLILGMESCSCCSHRASDSYWSHLWSTLLLSITGIYNDIYCLFYSLIY